MTRCINQNRCTILYKGLNEISKQQVDLSFKLWGYKMHRFIKGGKYET